MRSRSSGVHGSLRKSLARLPIEQKFSVSDVMTSCRVVPSSKTSNFDFGVAELNLTSIKIDGKGLEINTSC
jgi:hypothetical protein